jgi:hypothetical protein
MKNDAPVIDAKFCNFLGFAHTAQWNLLAQFVHLFGIAFDRCVERCIDGAGADVVDRDAVLREFERSCSRQHANTALRCTARCVRGHRQFFVHRRDIDDPAAPSTYLSG